MPIWIAWALAGVLASAETAWIALAGVRVIGVAWWHPWVFGLLASALALRGRFPRIAASCAGIALSLILLPVAVFFVYLCATPGLPLADHVLAAADHALGFDWPAWFRLTTASKTIRLSLTMLYGWGWTIQLGALPPLLPIFSPCRHAEFLTINVTALLLISLGSMLMPAAGAPFYFGVVPAQFARAALIAGHETFLALRENPHLINIGWPQGVIAFPSYHAAGTVIFAYAVRGARRPSSIASLGLSKCAHSAVGPYDRWPLSRRCHRGGGNCRIRHRCRAGPRARRVVRTRRRSEHPICARPRTTPFPTVIGLSHS